MLNPETELLFPPRLIPELRELRGPAWQELVDEVQRKEGVDPDRLALVLLVVKLAGCASCHANSFKALRGCPQCAAQAVRRFRGDDGELVRCYTAARQEVDRYLVREKR